MANLEWRTIEYDGESSRGRVLSTAGEWLLVVIPAPDEPRDTLVYLRDDRIVSTETYGAPSAGDVTPDGIAVIADWREFGQKTNTDIHLIDITGEEHQQFTVEHSSPLVAITSDGAALAVSSFDGMIRIYDAADFSARAHHSVLFGDRLVPSTNMGDTNRICLQSHDDAPPLKYSIDLSGEVQSTTDEVELIRYVESFELDHTTEWEDIIPELLERYDEAAVEYTKNQIANVIGNGSLAHISNSDRLDSIINALEAAHRRFNDEHRKLASKVLSDAHYRLGKARYQQGDATEFFTHLTAAESYAEEVLPWYDGKKLLAKIHRRKARIYENRGEIEEAKSNVNRIFELEQEYDVSLASKADERLRDGLSF